MTVGALDTRRLTVLAARRCSTQFNRGDAVGLVDPLLAGMVPRRTRLVNLTSSGAYHLATWPGVLAADGVRAARDTSLGEALAAIG